MKKSRLINAALLMVVVALGWFVYLKPRSDEPASYPLSELKADQVRHIRLERRGGAAIVLEKEEDSWRITAPFAAHADPFHVQRLLAILNAKSAHRLAATDLARFDLERPQTRLVIDGASFDFGTVSTVTGEQYVRSGGAVYPIDARYGEALPADAAQLIRKQLLAPGEAPVRFEFRDFSVAQSEGRWRVTPQVAELSQDDLNRWVDAWREAAALRVEPYAGKKLIGEIKLEFRDGRQLTLGILQREPELILERPDEKLQYYFFSETAKRLLAPPGGKPQ